MTFFKKKSLMIVSLLIFALLIQVCPVSSWAQDASSDLEYELPEDIKIKKENYESLFVIAEKYPTTYITQVNNQEERLQSLVFVQEPGNIVDGEMIIDLPSEIVRVISFFRQVNILGENIKNVEVVWERPNDENIKMSEFWRSEDIIIGRGNRFVVKHGDYEGHRLIIKGTGVINRIELNEPNGLAPFFDVTAWSVLGGNKDILPINIDIDTSKQLSIEGVDHVEVEKFHRVYARPISSPETYITNVFLKEKGFLPGRQILKFGPALETAYGDPNAPKLKEDPNKEGYSDYSFFEEHYQKDQESVDLFDANYPTDMKYVSCYNYWPSWMRPDVPNNPHGTPAIDKFEPAADLAAEYTKAYDRFLDGRGPDYIEVVNEPTVRSGWIHHDNPDLDSWKLLAEFHNMVADRIKELSPDVKVGGPTSAWMALDDNNFSLANEQLRFMDLTKDSLDFYSHHFYEGNDLILHETDDNYGGYLTGRLEADLDLLRNHMILTDNVKPLIISETGTLHNGPTDVDYWLLLKNFNSYLVRYMNRANEFEMIVPFLLPIKWWQKEAPDMLFTYNEDGTVGEPTKLRYFLDLWQAYKGKLLPVHADNDKVFVHAAQDDNVIYVAVNNMNPQRIAADLNLDLDDEDIYDIEQTRLYLNLGKIQFLTQKLSSLEDIPLSVEETSIIKITLEEAPELEETLLKKTYYGDKVLQDTGVEAAFQISCPVEDLERSTLRVGFGRQDGFNQPMTVWVNGHEYTYDLSFSNKNGRFFTYADFKLPTNILHQNNEIKVLIPQEGGKISSVSLITETIQDDDDEDDDDEDDDDEDDDED